jgi:hypothetical protein
LMTCRFCSCGVRANCWAQKRFRVCVRVRNICPVIWVLSELFTPVFRKLKPSGRIPEFNDIARDGAELGMAENDVRKSGSERRRVLGHRGVCIEQAVKRIRADDAFYEMEVTVSITGPHQIEPRDATELHRKVHEVFKERRHRWKTSWMLKGRVRRWTDT